MQVTSAWCFYKHQEIETPSSTLLLVPKDWPILTSHKQLVPPSTYSPGCKCINIQKCKFNLSPIIFSSTDFRNNNKLYQKHLKNIIPIKNLGSKFCNNCWLHLQTKSLKQHLLCNNNKQSLLPLCEGGLIDYIITLCSI